MEGCKQLPLLTVLAASVFFSTLLLYCILYKLKGNQDTLKPSVPDVAICIKIHTPPQRHQITALFDSKFLWCVKMSTEGWGIVLLTRPQVVVPCYWAHWVLCCDSSPDALVVPGAAVSAGSSHSRGLTAATQASEFLTPLPSAGSTCLAREPLTHTQMGVGIWHIALVTLKNPQTSLWTAFTGLYSTHISLVYASDLECMNIKNVPVWMTQVALKIDAGIQPCLAFVLWKRVHERRIFRDW